MKKVPQRGTFCGTYSGALARGIAKTMMNAHTIPTQSTKMGKA